MDKIRVTAILRIALFLIGIVGITLLVIKASSQPLFESEVRAATQSSPLTFTWGMPERFGAKLADGTIDFHWNEARREYAADYVNPSSWKVDFDACSQDGTPPTGSTFAWQIDAVDVPNLDRSSCRFSHEFATQGTYIVRVTRTANGSTETAELPVTVKDLLIVSLGDSFASGQGNPDIEKNGVTPAKWIDRICARSEKSGPAQAALSVEKEDPHTSVTFLSLACSGAEIDAGILHDQTPTVKPQIDELRKTLRGRSIDALVISIGGNDIGFSDLVARCILHKHCDHHAATLDKFTTALGRLEALYQALSDSIATLPSVKKVFITEYPDLVRDEKGNLCDGKPKGEFLLQRINASEAGWASGGVIAGLNLKVKQAAEKHGWIYVSGISEKFRTHGYCAADKERWVRTFGDAKRTQGVEGKCRSVITSLSTTKDALSRIRECLISSGAVHPAEQGHKRGYAPSLVAAWRKEGVIAPATSLPPSAAISAAKP